ncbi:hypothetical protein A2U01_0006663, partial [Trifolium medium]|nr:hypothetical protein [Trifolium medium]
MDIDELVYYSDYDSLHCINLIKGETPGQSDDGGLNPPSDESSGNNGGD